MLLSNGENKHNKIALHCTISRVENITYLLSLVIHEATQSDTNKNERITCAVACKVYNSKRDIYVRLFQSSFILYYISLLKILFPIHI